MTEKKFTKPQSRLTLKRNPQESNKVTGIFSNGIQSTRILISKEEEQEGVDNTSVGCLKDVSVEISPLRHPSPSTSSIYLASRYASSSDDYDKKIFNEPDDFELAQFHHARDLSREDDWFEDTVNYTQSQRPGGFIQRHSNYYRFNSQR